jgi:uroporphyrin-III C-methyltransferase/precorrin-2 dehydrogenase/sirohydrochlorin ferrochelatase
MKAFPLFITVEARPLVVFGGGEEAAAKLRLLLKTDAEVIAVASSFEAAVTDLPGVKLVYQNPLCFELSPSTPFAYAATGDEQFDAELSRKARAAGVLVCAVDQPGVSDFSTPALVDRDPVVVAIGTEGTAPVLARAVKAQIEFILEPSLGLIAKTASGLRSRVARALKPGQPRRDFWRSYFRISRTERLTSEEALRALGEDLLSRVDRDRTAGSLTIVGTGSGEADLLTIAGHRALDQASVVLHDPLTSRAVLELARREATIRVLELGASAEILRHVAAGKQVVRLVAGSGDLARDELQAVQSAGLPIRFIPGLDSNPATTSHAPAKSRALPSIFPRKAA